MSTDNPTILVVDDHEIVREGVRSILAAYRPAWTVLEAANGTEAMGCVRSAAPDLLVMDITMPDASGLQVTSELRKSGFERPILIFTMHQSKSLGGETTDAGAQGYVLKSQASQDLVRAIDTLLAGGTFFGAPLEPQPAPSEPSPGLLMFLRVLLPDWA